MKKLLLLLSFVFCTFVGFGQYKEYSKSEFEKISAGPAYDDIRLTGFKDNEHAKRVIHALSTKGHLQKHSFYITDKGDFVVQPEKKVGLLFKDEYVLYYLPHYRQTEVFLEFYKLAYKPWNQDVAQGGSAAKPTANLKQALDMVEDVKKFAALYASNENELQNILKEGIKMKAGQQQKNTEEARARAAKEGGKDVMDIATEWLSIHSELPAWASMTLDQRYNVISAVAYGMGYHPDPALNKCKFTYYNPNRLSETNFSLAGSPVDVSQTYAYENSGEWTFEHTLKNKPIVKSELHESLFINGFLFFEQASKVYAYEINFLKAEYHLGYVYEWVNGQLKFFPLSSSNKKNKAVKEAFENDIADRIQKINAFLENTEIRNSYYSELQKHYGKQWDEKWAGHAKKIQEESRRLMHSAGYTLTAWVSGKTYSPLEGIWYFDGVPSSHCITLHYGEIRKFHDSQNGKYALAFSVNAKGEIEIKESTSFVVENGLQKPASLASFQKIEGSVKKQGTGYVVHLKKYGYTFTVSLKENELESALADYYSGKESLKELQQFVFTKERPETGYSVYRFTEPEAYFKGSKCDEGIHLTFRKFSNAVPNQIIALEPANEKAGQKFNFSGNYPAAFAFKKETIVKVVPPSPKTAKNEQVSKTVKSAPVAHSPATPKTAAPNAKSPADYFNAYLAAIKNNDPNKALRELQESVQAYPNDARLYAALGLVYLDLPNRQKAYDCFKKVEQLEPSMLKKMYKKEIVLGPIYPSDGEVFNNVLFVSPTYGIVAGNKQIRVTNCDFVCRTGIQFGGMGISISDSFFDTVDMCVEYTQISVQIGNVFMNNKFYGQWSNAE